MFACPSFFSAAGRENIKEDIFAAEWYVAPFNFKDTIFLYDKRMDFSHNKIKELERKIKDKLIHSENM